MKALALLLVTLVILGAGVWAFTTFRSDEPSGTGVPDSTEVPHRADYPACTPNGAFEPESPDTADTHGRPVRLLIESIGVDATVRYVGLNQEGRMDVPRKWDNVAWYELGPIPGDQGNAIIAGHYDAPGGIPAVFFDLNQLEPGDDVQVTTQNDETLLFEVIEVDLMHVDQIDAGKIFGATEEQNLNLITCAGDWDPSIGMYDHRLIVFTRLEGE